MDHEALREAAYLRGLVEAQGQHIRDMEARLQTCEARMARLGGIGLVLGSVLTLVAMFAREIWRALRG
jgi:hypothetical protein